ncbi:MAG: efflux RND transporter periplasmic adaptor subunit [Treponema sp.]|nr:efflux RND transporter periplasmic adaptor subunit [Treponema sp.]
MKLNKKTTGALIFILLVLLLFFSKTIYTYNMPEVTGTRPKRGSLSKLEISSGIAAWADTEMIYASCAGTVGRVFAREGDRVERGQILFEMDFNITAAQRRLAETDNNISRLQADIRGSISRLNSIKEALAAAVSPSGANNLMTDLPDTETESQLPSVSGQEGLITIEIARARIALANAQFAYEIGSMSRNDFTNAENNLKALLYKYEADANDIEHSVVLKQIDLENLKLSRETIQEILRDYRNNAVIRSPADGIILEMPAERGKFFQENILLASIGAGNEFTVECNISLDNNFVNQGDTCELSNASHVLKGTVRRVRPSANAKTVTITLISDNVSGGETFNITFEKNSSSSFTLVPNNAINQDNDGYFIYQIKRRKGIMGDEYYLDRLGIFIGDSDHQNTAVLRGITFFEPVVLVSNKALNAGITVSLKNPEDFFEN